MADGLDGEQVRRTLLKVVISELTGGHIKAEQVLSPTCPVCGEGPAMVMPAGTQAFCGNDDCDVLMWNPTLPDTQVHEGQELVAHTDPVTGSTTWKPKDDSDG